MLKVCTTFSGYDSQCLALDRLGIPYDLVGWSDIDKYAIKAHNSLYPQWKERNLGDIRCIDWDKVEDFDCLTYSSPCQSFSFAGKQEGGVKDSGTESSLIWFVENAIKVKRPKYLMLENVAAFVSKKFIGTFNDWCGLLESYGYRNYWSVLDSKDFGSAQSRKRVFLISIRKDIDQTYEFPVGMDDTKRIIDILEEKVDPSYYLPKEKWYDLQDRLNENYVKCDRDEPKIGVIGNLTNGHRAQNVYDINGISPTVMENHGQVHKIVDSNQNLVRKMTPREYFRLMGLVDGEIDKIQSVVPKSQQYKLAGNSIVVNVLTALFDKLLNG